MRKSKTGVTGQAFSYFARRIHVILTIKSIIRNTETSYVAIVQKWKF